MRTAAHFFVCFLFFLICAEVASPSCHYAYRHCVSTFSKTCRIATEIACKCKDLTSENCENYSPVGRFEKEIKRVGDNCSPKRCRLKIYWCKWSYWSTVYSNTSCAGTFYHQKRTRERCCNLFRRQIRFICDDRSVQKESKYRDTFEPGNTDCEVPGTVSMAWYEKLGYGIAAAFGFALVVKCFRICCCKKPAPPEEEAQPADANFENVPLEIPAGAGTPEALAPDPSAPPPETLPLDPNAPPPSYDEVACKPDQFELPEKRY